jgi:hypothetical protein
MISYMFRSPWHPSLISAEPLVQYRGHIAA